MNTSPSPSPRAVSSLALLVAGTFFMENLDATVITPAIPAMAQSFAVRPVDLNIGVSAYLLTVGVFIPVSGWLADRFGARRVFTAAIAIFTLASLGCALSNSLPLFVAMRMLQGVGGAMMVPVGRLVVLRATPKEGLINAIAVLTWPALVAFVLGPPLGGFIADQLDWRWIFYVNLPLGIVAFLFALVIVPGHAGERPPAFDWLGFALAGPALACLLWAAELMGRPVIAWGETVVFAAAGLVLGGLAILHMRRASAPMIGFDALGQRTFRVTLAGGSLFRMGVSAVPFLVPLMLQLGLGFTALQSGSMLMAVFAGNLLIKPLTTPIIRRFGFRSVLIGNGILNAVAIGACALFTAATPLWLMALILFIGGATRSMQFTSFNTIAFSDIPRPMMTAANTLFSTGFQFAMGLGAALGAIAWRIGEQVAPVDATAALPFQIAFAIVALVSLAGTVDSFRLPANAGSVVSGHGTRRA